MAPWRIGKNVMTSHPEKQMFDKKWLDTMKKDFRVFNGNAS